MATLALAHVRLEVDAADRTKLRGITSVMLLGSLIDTNPEGIFNMSIPGIDASLSRINRDIAVADAVKTELTARGNTVLPTDTVAVE